MNADPVPYFERREPKLAYAAAKFDNAVAFMAKSPKPLRDRLCMAWSEVARVDVDAMPDESRKGFLLLRSSIASIAHLSDEMVQRLAVTIVDIRCDVETENQWQQMESARRASDSGQSKTLHTSESR